MTKGCVRTRPASSSSANVAFRPQVINPYRRIDQDHAPAGLTPRRRLEVGLARAQPRQPPGALALDARLERFANKAGFLLRPVKAWAWATSSSSSASVVRIRQSPTWRQTSSSKDAGNNASIGQVAMAPRTLNLVLRNRAKRGVSKDDRWPPTHSSLTTTASDSPLASITDRRAKPAPSGFHADCRLGSTSPTGSPLTNQQRAGRRLALSGRGARRARLLSGRGR